MYTILQFPQGADRGSWTIASIAYSYELLDLAERRVIAYHRHPDTPPIFPHLHVGRQFAHAGLPRDASVHAAALVRAHLPTDRVSLVSVLRLAITELGVDPIRSDWDRILNETQESTETQ